MEKNYFVSRMSSLRTSCVWLFIAILCWVPFPLGGAIEWAAGVQALLVSICVILWLLSSSSRINDIVIGIKRIAVPFCLVFLVILWAWIQSLPVVPSSWAHPLWTIAADTLRLPVDASVSVNPWRTQAEALKLLCYALSFWLAYDMSRQIEFAELLLKAAVTVVTIYSAFGFFIAFIGYNAHDIFYATPSVHRYVTGPFVLHNSFATFCGLGTVAAVAKLTAEGSQSIVAVRSIRLRAFSVIQFILGRGAKAFLATILCFSGVIASASRAGFIAMLVALIAMVGIAFVAFIKKRFIGNALIAVVICIMALFLFVGLSGDTLISRMNLLQDPETTDEVRLALWGGGIRMIHDSPFLGIGLGSFQDIFPLYALKIFPFVMDKAHCDYLEFAAGVGLPAACAWWLALSWGIVLCFVGFFKRKRMRYCPLVGGVAGILVAVHSTVDFSLQLPAVSMLFAILLGVGIAQSRSSRNSQGLTNL